MFHRSVRRVGVLILLLALPAMARADVTLRFSAEIGSTNNVDTGNIFNEGAGANLQGQIITGTATIGSAGLVQECGSGGGCYGDFGAGSIRVSFTLNGITSTVVSTGRMGYYGDRSGGSVSIMDPAPSDGGYNNFEVQADNPDGTLQEQIGAMYNLQSAFSAYGGSLAAPDPAAAIDSLTSIDEGQLVWGGITLLTPTEHLDAEVIGITVPVPEPAGLGLAGLVLAAAVRRWRGAVRRFC